MPSGTITSIHTLLRSTYSIMNNMPEHPPRAPKLTNNIDTGSLDNLLSYIDNYEGTIPQPSTANQKRPPVVSPIQRLIEQAAERMPEALIFPLITVWRKLDRSFKDEDIIQDALQA